MARILFINYEFPPLGGGGGHASDQIARRLVVKGHDVSVMTSAFRGLPREETIAGVKIFRMPTWRRHREKCSVGEMLVFLLMSFIFAPLIHRRVKPDVVVSFFSIPSGPAAWLLNLLFGTPYIIGLRGGDVPGFLPEHLGKFHNATNWFTRMMWKRADAITANSQGLLDLAKIFMKHQRMSMIPNGVDENFYHVASFETVAGSKSPMKLLSVGRLSIQKKIERLLDVMVRLAQIAPGRFELDIVGDGPCRPDLEKKAAEANLLNTHVRFKGWLPREDLPGIYREADVFCITSDFEGMPNTVLEAIASSLAVVGTRSQGTDELVRENENGCLVSAQRLKEFDEVLMRLERDRKLLADWKMASHRIARTYSWDSVANAYEKLVSEVLK